MEKLVEILILDEVVFPLLPFAGIHIDMFVCNKVFACIFLPNMSARFITVAVAERIFLSSLHELIYLAALAFAVSVFYLRLSEFILSYSRSVWHSRSYSSCPLFFHLLLQVWPLFFLAFPFYSCGCQNIHFELVHFVSGIHVHLLDVDARSNSHRVGCFL